MVFRHEDGSGRLTGAYGGFAIKDRPISVFSILLALLASMGGFIFGYEAGQFDNILSLGDFTSRFGRCDDASGVCELSRARSGLLVGFLSIGTLVGSLLGAPVADSFGRRNAMSFGCGVFTLGALLQITSIHAWYQFAIGRLVAGLGAGALSVAVPMYQAETAPARLRGALTGTFELSIAFGTLVAYFISIGTREVNNSGSWRIVVGTGIAFALFLGTSIHLLPESPHWDAQHGSPVGARRAIARVHALPEDHPVVNNRLEEILDGTGRLSGSNNSPAKRKLLSHKRYDSVTERWFKEWINCFKGYKAGSSRIGYRTLLGMSLQSLQQLTGANYFAYFGETILQAVGIADSYKAQIILGTIDFVCTFLGLCVMERFGRRLPLILGGIWQSVWLFVFAAAGVVKDPTFDEGVAKLMTVSMCLFMLGYATTWGPGVWILIGETFPTRSRAKQSALSTASNWFWNFLIAFFAPYIVSKIGFRYVFVFASCNLLGTFVVYFFLYESAGLSLENVDLMYRDASVKPWSSRQWCPPEYLSRADVESEVREQRGAANADEEGAEKRETDSGCQGQGTED